MPIRTLGRSTHHCQYSRRISNHEGLRGTGRLLPLGQQHPLVREQDIDNGPVVYGDIYFHELNGISLCHAAIGYQVQAGTGGIILYKSETSSKYASIMANSTEATWHIFVLVHAAVLLLQRIWTISRSVVS